MKFVFTVLPLLVERLREQLSTDRSGKQHQYRNHRQTAANYDRRPGDRPLQTFTLTPDNKCNYERNQQAVRVILVRPPVAAELDEHTREQEYERRRDHYRRQEVVSTNARFGHLYKWD